jgi:hypothetical protein
MAASAGMACSQATVQPEELAAAPLSSVTVPMAMEGDYEQDVSDIRADMDSGHRHMAAHVSDPFSSLKAHLPLLFLGP